MFTSIKRPLAAFGLYLLLTLGMTYPWVTHFASHTPDGGGESSVFLWNIWHFRQALFQGTPFQTELLLVPYGANLAFHTYTVSRNLLALPLLPVFGLVLSHNLLTLLSFGLAGLGVWLLVDDLTHNFWASFVAGLVYTFAPYRFAHLIGHYNLATIEWLPLFALFALRFLASGRTTHLLAATLFALLTSLTEYTYGLYLAIWLTMIVVWQLVAFHNRLATSTRALLLAGAVLLAHTPLLVLLRQASAAGALVGRPPGTTMLTRFSADLAAFITPSAQHPLFGAWATEVSKQFTANFAEATVYLGVVPLALLLLALFQVRALPAAGRVWLLCFGGFLLLALGPELHWYGQVLLPLPYGWLSELPGFREARVPSRMTVMVMLALAVLVGLALHRLANQRTLIYALAGALILFEYLPLPLPIADRTVAPVYRAIAAEPGNRSVLELPFAVNDGFRNLGGWNPRAMYHQTVTAHPLVGGHIARIPPAVFEGYTHMPILARLAALERGAQPTAAEISSDRQTVSQLIETLNLGYIVLPQRQQASPTHAYLQAVFSGCLEQLPGDQTVGGYRVVLPCSG